MWATITTTSKYSFTSLLFYFTVILLYCYFIICIIAFSGMILYLINICFLLLFAFSNHYFLFTVCFWIIEPRALLVIWQICQPIYSCFSLFLSPRSLNMSSFFKHSQLVFEKLVQWQHLRVNNSKTFVCFLGFIMESTKSSFRQL